MIRQVIIHEKKEIIFYLIKRENPLIPNFKNVLEHADRSNPEFGDQFCEIKRTIRSSIEALDTADLILIEYAPDDTLKAASIIRDIGFVPAPSIEAINLVIDNKRELAALQKTKGATPIKVIGNETLMVGTCEKAVTVTVNESGNNIISFTKTKPDAGFYSGATYLLAYPKN